jgi:hypothetical protein
MIKADSNAQVLAHLYAVINHTRLLTDSAQSELGTGIPHLCWPKTSSASRLWSMTSFCGRIIASKL